MADDRATSFCLEKPSGVILANSARPEFEACAQQPNSPCDAHRGSPFLLPKETYPYESNH